MSTTVELEKPKTTSQSLALQEKARTWIPGMTQLLSKRPDMFSPGVWPGYYSKAKGAEVWDLDGKRYVDMSIGGIGANVLGYADPEVDAAVTRAINDGVSCSLNCPEEVELAELLCEIHPWAENVRYARTGGEAMAVAVRIARAATGRDKVAFCGYHGWHDWYLAANIGTENALGRHLLPGLAPTGVPSGLEGTALPFTYNKIAELEAILTQHKNQLAAIVIEPIRSENPLPGFLKDVKRLAEQAGAVFIVDEISSGFRMNSGGAHLKLGVTPDIAVFSKAIGNGYAMAAIIGTKEVMQEAQTTFISSTNWTERIGPTAALATIRKHRRENAGAHLMTIGQMVQTGWRNLAARHGLMLHVSGIPPLSHFVFEGEEAQAMKSLFVQKMLEHGFLASNLFYSMLAHTPFHVDQYLTAIDSVFATIKRIKTHGDIRESLIGGPATAGFKRLT